jgi:hypothetical protein
MTFTHLLVIALAGYSVYRVWFDEDSFLATLKAHIELWQPGFFKSLLTCKFCFSYHAPFWVPGLLLLLSAVAWQPLDCFAEFVLWSLAATGLILLVHKVLPSERIETIVFAEPIEEPHDSSSSASP